MLQFAHGELNLLLKHSLKIQNINGFFFFSIVSVILALLIAFEKFIIPDVPLDVNEAMSRQENIEGILVKGQRIDNDRDEPPDDDDNNNYLEFNPSAEFIDVDTIQDIPNNQHLSTWKP